jgi:hypothetical protein
LFEGLSLTVKFYLHGKEDGKLEFEVKWEPGIGLLKVQGTSFLRGESPEKSVIVWQYDLEEFSITEEGIPTF